MRGKGRWGPGQASILTGMLSLAVFSAWLGLRSDVLDGHFYRFPVLGLTHVATLGWISLMIQGVLFRLTPMVLGVEPRSRVLGFTVWGLWVVGGTGLVVHMGSGEWFGAWTAGILLLAGAALLLPLHRGVIRRARQGDWIARYVVAAMVHLLLGAVMGIAIAVNHHLALFAVSPYRALGVHVHLAELGWVTFMILGIGRRLLPSLAPPRDREPGESRVRFLLLETGLLLLVIGLLVAPPMVPPAALILLGAIALHAGRPVGRLFRGEIRDRASFWASVACLNLLAGALLGTAIAFGIPGRLGIPPDRALYAYGVTAILGWNLLAVSAFAVKLFPLWAWEGRFRAELGAGPVPPMAGLASRFLQEGAGVGAALGTAAAATGLLAGVSPVAMWGGRLASVGGIFFVINFVRIARWELLPLRYHPGPEDVERYRAYVDVVRSRGGNEPSTSPGGARGDEDEEREDGT